MLTTALSHPDDLGISLASNSGKALSYGDGRCLVAGSRMVVVPNVVTKEEGTVEVGQRQQGKRAGRGVLAGAATRL